MQIGTVLLVVLAGLAALLIALYQYAHRSKLPRKLLLTLTFLRFLAIFAVLLLLINPKLSRETFSLVPPQLLLLSDNSSSMQEGNAGTQQERILEQFSQSDELQDRFEVYRYSFGSELKQTDSLSLTEPTTNLSSALSSLNRIYSPGNTVIVALTDGNQTLGQDYEFLASAQKIPVFPVALGDSTRYEDLRIEQVISNKYAFLNNQYPIETYVSYEGPSPITTQLSIWVDDTKVDQQLLRLSPATRSLAVSSLLRADAVGIRNIRISVSPLENERNTRNNQRRLAIEVVDEQTKVALVSDILHPDLGAMEKAIRSNEQRTVVSVRPEALPSEYEEADLFILYQPNSKFRRIYEFIEQSNASTFTVTGVQTDWNFLNRSQGNYEKENLSHDEEILPVLNPGFSLFDLADFNIDDFPPLEGELGDIMITKPHETLIGQRIRGVDINEPLLAVINDQSRKEAVLFAENLWKWRMQAYRNQGSFENFDALIGKIILYLASDNTNRRFSLDYSPLFQGNNDARIRASFFDETFVFDGNASLLLRINGTDNSVNREVPMLLKGSYFEADLTDLPPGTYNFTARVEGEKFSGSGSFTILDFEVEKQLLATDYKRLGRLADKTGGKLYFPDTSTDLLQFLAEDERFAPVRKSKQIVVSLIDFRWLLAIIAASLAIEWFIRKFNGLI